MQVPTLLVYWLGLISFSTHDPKGPAATRRCGTLAIVPLVRSSLAHAKISEKKSVTTSLEVYCCALYYDEKRDASVPGWREPHRLNQTTRCVNVCEKKEALLRYTNNSARLRLDRFGKIQ